MDIINWEEFLLPYSQAVNELVVKLKALSNECIKMHQHSPIEQVDGRVKRVGSILEKANRKNIPLDKISEKIEDIAGVRVICRFVEDIERVIELIRQREGFDMTLMQERDYIANRKASGYQSYHILIKYSVMTLSGAKEVWAEIQIRTLAMNFWATIEHSLKYKYNNEIPRDVQDRLYNSAEAAFALDREMSTIRGEITEAQKIIQVKNDLVDSIVKKIKSLYYVARMDKVNDLNREFIDLYQECNIEKLVEFDMKLNTMAKVYKVEFE